MYHAIFAQFAKELHQVDKWFDAAVAHAEAKKFDPNLFLHFRLAPDQFSFVRQVQAVCDVAKLAASRLTGKDAPKHEDTETSIEELRVRVKAVIEYLGTLSPQDFEGAATRSVTTPRWEGKTMTGEAYFLQHGMPNFWFHLTHSYAILRHNGVNIGKRDYLGPITFSAPA